MLECTPQRAFQICMMRAVLYVRGAPVLGYTNPPSPIVNSKGDSNPFVPKLSVAPSPALLLSRNSTDAAGMPPTLETSDLMWSIFGVAFNALTIHATCLAKTGDTGRERMLSACAREIVPRRVTPKPAIQSWIPAFAGMTTVDGLAVTRLPSPPASCPWARGAWPRRRE